MITKLDMRDAVPSHVRTLGCSSGEPCTSGQGFEFLLALLADGGRGEQMREGRSGMRGGRARGNMAAVGSRPGSAGARTRGRDRSAAVGIDLAAKINKAETNVNEMPASEGLMSALFGIVGARSVSVSERTTAGLPSFLLSSSAHALRPRPLPRGLPPAPKASPCLQPPAAVRLHAPTARA